MGSVNRVEFYRRREHDQLKLAERATDPAIARIHHELAQRYAAIVAEQSPEPQPPGS